MFMLGDIYDGGIGSYKYNEMSDKVLNKHPEWRQKSKRLTGPFDHTNPTHWEGDLLCRNVVPSVSWDCGKEVALDVLPAGINIDLLQNSVSESFLSITSDSSNSFNN